MNSTSNTTHAQIKSLDSAATGLAGGNNLRGDHTPLEGVSSAGLVSGATHGSHAHHDGLGSHAGGNSVTSGGAIGNHAKQALPSVGLAGGVDHHANAHSNTGINYGDTSLGFTPGLVSAHQPAHAVANNPDGANFDTQPNLDEHLHATGVHNAGDGITGQYAGGNDLTTGETRGVHHAFRVGLAGADRSQQPQEAEAGRSKTHFPHAGNAAHSADGSVHPATGAHVDDGHSAKKAVQTSGGLKMNVA